MADDSSAPGMSSRQFAGRIIATMAVGLAALLVMAGTAWWLVGKANAYSALVDHTYAAEAKMFRMVSLIEQTETIRRGYLLDPTAERWRLYEDSASLTPDAVREVEIFVADNPSQVARVAALRRLASIGAAGELGARIRPRVRRRCERR